DQIVPGPLTLEISKLEFAGRRLPPAICDLKGRIQFGLWIMRRSEDAFELIVSHDLLEDLIKHLKKYGAFSKIQLSEPLTLIPAVINGQADFEVEVRNDELEWQQIAVANGQAWITRLTTGLFQPQELRLHQREGVDYDKGCYLGQEIVARLYFRAKPKHWLHRISGTGELPQAGQHLAADIQVVNAVMVEGGWQALVVAKPAALEASDFDVLELPEGLNGEVGRVV
ncbi:MAG: folate-binding Fe/S cluster repair protein, partial [Pseudomonadota bacterium]|nr:folate-binding Fe/S cluster repair protein [Pseudomonadota bacterium]